GHGVAGVRLVGDTFELLDEGGAPRLHMESPFVLDADKVRHPAKVMVSGCKYDTDPRGPWGRPITLPRAAACVVHLAWGANLRRPLLVDPQWSTTVGVGARTAAFGSGKVLGASLGTTTKIYDVATWSAAATGSFAVSRTYPSMTAIAGGKLLAVGSDPGNCL